VERPVAACDEVWVRGQDLGGGGGGLRIAAGIAGFDLRLDVEVLAEYVSFHGWIAIA
jgi:hypothetical protein